MADARKVDRAREQLFRRARDALEAVARLELADPQVEILVTVAREALADDDVQTAVRLALRALDLALARMPRPSAPRPPEASASLAR
jgi:hypothetical protein